MFTFVKNKTVYISRLDLLRPVTSGSINISFEMSVIFFTTRDATNTNMLFFIDIFKRQCSSIASYHAQFVEVNKCHIQSHTQVYGSLIKQQFVR